MELCYQGSRESLSRPWTPWLEAFFISKARLYGGAMGGCTGSKLRYDPSAPLGRGYERSESYPLRSPHAKNGIYTLFGPSSQPLLQSVKIYIIVFTKKTMREREREVFFSCKKRAPLVRIIYLDHLHQKGFRFSPGGGVNLFRWSLQGVSNSHRLQMPLQEIMAFLRLHILLQYWCKWSRRIITS